MNIIGHTAKLEQPATLHQARRSTPAPRPCPLAVPGVAPACPLKHCAAGGEQAPAHPLGVEHGSNGATLRTQLSGGTRGSPYLLLNFSGCFSRMRWKRWAMEASCGERE